MARKRSISSDISTDPKLAQLAGYGVLPLLIYTWGIPHADDWGRLPGDPVQFKLMVCPAFPASYEQIEEAIKQVAEVGLWQFYIVDGKKYIAYPREAWFKHQSYINTSKRDDDSKSAYPAPPDWYEDKKQHEKPKGEEIAKQHQETPRNSNDRQEIAQNPVSPSPSPSLSPTPTPTREKDSCPNPAVTDDRLNTPDVVAGESSEKPKYTEDSIAYKAACYLRSRILENNPRARVPGVSVADKLMQNWAQEMDRLNRIGPPGGKSDGSQGYSWDEIGQLVNFSQDDEFWKANILSAGKLREQCVQLENQLKRNITKARGHPKSTMARNVANALRLVEKYEAEDNMARSGDP